MKSVNKILSLRKALLPIVGVLAAVVMLAQPPIQYLADEIQPDSIAVADEQSNEEGEQQEADQQLRVAYDVVIPVLQINLFHSFDLLVELPEVEQIYKPLKQRVHALNDSFFRTLFRQIISPNAP